MSELKECPFCGHETRVSHSDHEEYRDQFDIECENDLCSVRVWAIANSEQEVIEKWNTRVEKKVENNHE